MTHRITSNTQIEIESSTGVSVGDYQAGTYALFSAAGAQRFVGTGSGLCYGEIYASDASDTIAIADSGQANRVQITSFDTNGAANNMTPDHTNDHITVTVAGFYLCTVSISCSSGTGTGFTGAFSVYKNNGTTEFANCHTHRELAGGGGDTGSLSMSGLIDLAASDTIEVWCWNEDNATDIVINDITLTLVQVGGT